MLSVKKLIRSEKRHQLLLGVVFALYILLNVQTPKMIAGLVNNLVGNVVIILVALTILMNSHPVVGVLGLVVAYELIRRSGVSSGTYNSVDSNFVSWSSKSGTSNINYDYIFICYASQVIIDSYASKGWLPVVKVPFSTDPVSFNVLLRKAE